jgi:tRNA (mo5U34)-methyltransferase
MLLFKAAVVADSLARMNFGELHMQISRDEAEALMNSIPHWHHRFEIYPGLVTPGSYDPSFLWEKLRFDDRCKGQRVLDVGTSDGYFSKRIDTLGGEVVCVDYRRKSSHGFGVMEQLHGSTFPYEHSNVYELDTERLGTFDFVLFLGVLYHLPDMMRALRKLRTLCRSTLFLETHSDNVFCPGFPAARYHKGASLAGDLTNFWSPNELCVLDMLHDAGFDVVRHETWSDRLFTEAVVSTDPDRLYKTNIAYGVL